MNKNNRVMVLVFLILIIIAGVYYWKIKKSSLNQPVENGGAGSGEILPSTSTNPLDNQPNINPVDQTNPFQNIKTNPFE